MANVTSSLPAASSPVRVLILFVNPRDRRLFSWVVLPQLGTYASLISELRQARSLISCEHPACLYCRHQILKYGVSWGWVQV